MANLNQVLTYAQTWETTIDTSGSVPVTVPPTTYAGSVVEVSNKYTTSVNGTELVRGSVAVTAAPGVDDLVVCDVALATQCFAYIEAVSSNTANITIAYVDEALTSTDIAVLAPGQSLYIPFLVSISAGGDCKLTGLAASGTQGVNVSASHNG